MSSEETVFHRNRSAAWLRTLHDEVLRAADSEERKQPLATVLGSRNRPGRSRDCSLELPQIRTCALNASGSSRWGIAVPHTTGWFRGDTLVRHRCPRRGSNSPSTTWHPLRSTGSGRAVPPLQHYYGALRLLAALLAALRFLRLAIPSFRPSFVPVGLGRRPRINLELVSRVSGRHFDGDGKVSQVPGEPYHHSPCSSDPGVTRHAVGSKCR